MQRRQAGIAMAVAGALSLGLGMVLLLGGSDDADPLADASTTSERTPIASEPTPTATEPTPTNPSPTEAASSEPAPAQTSETDAVFETTVDFFAGWEHAFVTSDPTFLLERLHPTVIEAYGTEACVTYLDGVQDPGLRVTVIGEEALDTYTLTVDGLDVPVDDPAVRVTLSRTDGDGDMYETQATLARLPDGLLTWFTDCGEPL